MEQVITFLIDNVRQLGTYAMLFSVLWMPEGFTFVAWVSGLMAIGVCQLEFCREDKS